MAPFDPSQPFTRREALAAGISDWQLRAPRYLRLFPSVYVTANTVVDTRIRALAALKVAPKSALLARHTAAELMGGVVPTSGDVHVLLAEGRLRVQGIDARCGAPTRQTRMDGLPVTSAEDTFAHLAHDLNLVDLVVLGDSLVKARRTVPQRLVAAAEHVKGLPGVKGRRAAELVREGVDSPMESRLRMLIVLAGLPEPVVNFIEYGERGHWRRRFDLSYPEHKLAIEYDGRQHATDQRQWEHDLERREGLDEDDWRIVVVLSKGLYVEPDRTLTRIVRAMGKTGMREQVSSAEWRRFFPGRG